MIAEQLDLANLTGLGVGAVLLALVFRTLWRQEGGWRAVLTASREDAKTAREDAAAARQDAAAARADAREARNAERECQRRVGRLEDQIAEIRATSSANTQRLDERDRHDSGEVPRTDPPGA